MIPDPRYNIWEHSQNVKELYAQRAAGEEEMDSSAQAVEILRPFIKTMGESAKFLDAGCGSGYLWASFKKRSLPIEYYGLDYSPSLIEIGRGILPQHGLSPDRLMCGAIEDLYGQKFDIVALINTLTFCPDYRQVLDRLAETGVKVLLIRDNFGSNSLIRWEEDGFLDPGYNHLKAYWNQWNIAEVSDFLAAHGFETKEITDQRTNGKVEMVVGKPYYWKWLLATRIPQGALRSLNVLD